MWYKWDEVERRVLDTLGISRFDDMKAISKNGDIHEVKLYWIFEVAYNSAKAYLGYVKTLDSAKAVLIPISARSHPFQILNISPVDVYDEIDVVSKALQNVDIIDDESKYMFGRVIGIGEEKRRWASLDYDLKAQVRTKQMNLYFSYYNWTFEELGAESMRNLWMAIKEFVNQIVTQSNNKELYDFAVDNWWIKPSSDHD